MGVSEPQTGDPYASSVLDRHEPLFQRAHADHREIDRAAFTIVAVILSVLLGVVVLGVVIASSSSAPEQRLSYSPEAAVVDDCPGASSSRTSEAHYVGETSNGSEIWGVPWEDSEGRTYAAWVLEASPTAPKKYDGTYSATNCTWVKVN